MKKSTIIAGIVALVLLAGAGSFYAARQGSPQSKMTFFVTSANPGKGADLGGLTGADSYCQALAVAADSGDQTWHAYLSAKAANGVAAVNARDRIGKGPWQNFQGAVIANDLAELHDKNNLNKQTALTEKGQLVNGRGDTPNRHDILTGSGPDGRVIAGDSDTTCNNWTSSDAGAAMLGHHDRMGTSDTDAAKSWNSSHLSRGCSLEALAGTGGGGLLYCFAVTE